MLVVLKLIQHSPGLPLQLLIFLETHPYEHEEHNQQYNYDGNTCTDV